MCIIVFKSVEDVLQIMVNGLKNRIIKILMYNKYALHYIFIYMCELYKSLPF